MKVYAEIATSAGKWSVGDIKKPKEIIMKGKYVGVPGVAPVPIDELINTGYCPQCGADYTQPDVPYAHKSVAGNIMPGHTA